MYNFLRHINQMLTKSQAIFLHSGILNMQLQEYFFTFNVTQTAYVKINYSTLHLQALKNDHNNTETPTCEH